MCAEPTYVASARASASRPQRSSSGRPRIEYSSSEPCALTRNGAPVAAPTGPPISTWFVNTTSAGSSSRSAAAFASTYARLLGVGEVLQELRLEPGVAVHHEHRQQPAGQLDGRRPAHRRGRTARARAPGRRRRRRVRRGSTRARARGCRRSSPCRRAGSRAREGSARACGRCYARWKYSACSSSTAGFDVCTVTSPGTSSSASE